MKFTEAGEVVLRIDTMPTPDSTTRITFHIIDTGIGIAPEHQAMIFGPFDRAETTAPREGTGLGLSIAQKQIELMGGRLRLESTPGRWVRSSFFP